MKYPEIFLIRHGETTWNRIGRHQGQLESVLTVNGINQIKGIARRLGREVKNWQSTSIASSPLFRCRQTAVILCDELEINVDCIVYDDRLMERCFGHWEGLTDTEISEKYPKEWTKRNLDPWLYSIPEGGENYLELSYRVSNWLTDQKTNRPILIISHGQTGRVLRGLILGLSSSETMALPQPQASAYHLSNGKAYLLEGEYL
jgi:probable phosphoglycerate mutase